MMQRSDLAAGGPMATPRRNSLKSLRPLIVIWAAVLAIHVVFRLPDIGLWIGFPALFAPWLLLGPQNWFDR
jgi:hypothetical protein